MTDRPDAPPRPLPELAPDGAAVAPGGWKRGRRDHANAPAHARPRRATRPGRAGSPRTVRRSLQSCRRNRPQGAGSRGIDARPPRPRSNGRPEVSPRMRTARQTRTRTLSEALESCQGMDAWHVAKDALEPAEDPA